MSTGLGRHAALWLACVAAVTLLHVPFLDLPYFWDEAGYYVPAALDLANHGRLIPQTTAANPHPPLVSIYLAAAYKLFGSPPIVTRLAMCLVAGTAVYSLLLLATLLLPASSGLWAAGLFALSPLFFAQSTLAHLDVAATAATLLTLYFAMRGQLVAYLVTASLLCLTRETGVVVVLVLAFLNRRPVMLLPVLSLAGWFAFLRAGTGHWLGDPGFVSYNVWEALHPARFLLTLLRRLYFLFVADFRFLLSAFCLLPSAFRLLPSGSKSPSSRVLLWWVLAAQVLVMSLFGGAILNRYLLPALALFYLLAIEAAGKLGQSPRQWALAALLAAQVGCWFWNPPYPFPFEENLAYADFVRLHQAAAKQLAELLPEARLLTAWPATDELTRPELGYIRKPARVVAMEDFSEESFNRVRREDFDAVLLYSREWQPEWNLLEEWPFLEDLRRTLYGRRPPASPEWVTRKFDLNRSGSIRLRGQWIMWLTRGDLRAPPRYPIAKLMQQVWAGLRAQFGPAGNPRFPPSRTWLLSSRAIARDLLVASGHRKTDPSPAAAGSE